MGYQISFIPNVAYDAGDLNGISGDFIAMPAVDFQDSILYGVDDLNAIRQDVVGKGILKNYGDECACSIVSGNIVVDSGKVFFDSGARMIIDASGISMEYTSGTSGYVWLEYRAALGVVLLRFTEDEPVDDYVLLATVAANGTVTDAREYCVSKLPQIVKTVNITLAEGAAAGDLVASVLANERDFQYATVYLASPYDYLPRSIGVWRLTDNYLISGIATIYYDWSHRAEIALPGATYQPVVHSMSENRTKVRCAYENGYLNFYRDTYHSGGIKLDIILS